MEILLGGVLLAGLIAAKVATDRKTNQKLEADSLARIEAHRAGMSAK